ncbi:MAG: hypothetical protein LQ344_002842 [Seirophora lacunosa]|nr:MAG: hypothetical protein LQ344_002842 [Seirophora lacunosa]
MDRRNNASQLTASDNNLGPLLHGIDSAIFALSTTVVVLRLFTRAWVTRNFGWDDAMMLLTQAITAVGKAFITVEVIYGLGQHRSALSADAYTKFLKYYYLDTAQFFIALATCKISICLFPLRFSQFDKLKRILCALIGFLLISHLVLFLLGWLPVFSFLTDFICAVFPIYLLRNLNIRRQSYTALCVLMGLGIVTGGIAIARTATTYQIKSPNLSWVSVPNALTRMFEVNIGNIAACVPIMKPFSRHVRAKITGRDPHQILQRETLDSEFHPRWYSRDRWTPGRVLSEKAEMNVPHEVKSFRTGTSRTGSIALPIQGTCGTYPDREQESDVPEIRNSHWFRLNETRHMDPNGF